MRFNNFFVPIGLMGLLPAIPLVMADECKIEPPPTESYDITVDFCYYHDFDIVDVRAEIPGAYFKEDHVELPVHVKANASPIHLDETYGVNIYFKNEWTDAHRWEASIPIIGPTLYVDLQTRINQSNCKLGLRLHLTGTGILGRLDETIDLTELDDPNIKLLAQSMKLCPSDE